VPKALALLAAFPGRGRSLALRAGENVRDADKDAVAEARWQLDRRFVGIALPAFAQLLTEPLATVVDTACCGRLGVAALGGMGVAVSAQYSLTKTFNDPLLRVTVSLVATTSPEDRREAVSAVVLLALLLGFVQVATFGVATGIAIQGMGVDPTSSMFGPAVAYLRFRALGAPFGSMLLALTGICRGLGDARTPMVASALATAVNVFLDPLLIFALGWGCAGAAVATVAAQFAGVICISWKLRALFSASRAPRWASVSAALRRFVTTAGVMIVRNWGKVFCFTFLARHAAQQGAIVSAAYSLTFQLGFATSQVAESLATSTQVLLAQALRDDGSFAPLSTSRSARQVVLRGLQAGLMLSAALGLATFVAKDNVLRFLTTSGQVQALAGAVMPWVLVAQAVKAMAYPTNGALMGALDWLCSAYILWIASFLGQALCRFSGGGSDPRGALVSLWVGLIGFFGTQLILGLLRIFSARGRWKVLGLQN